MIKIWVFIALLLVGCIPPTTIYFPNDSAEKQAIFIVWNETYYAQPWEQLPEVFWYQGTCLPGQRAGDCLVGAFFPPNSVYVLWRGAYSNSPMAHELLHALLYLRGQDDPYHLRPEWGYLVDRANRSLALRGF